jgi:hypothetical protein
MHRNDINGKSIEVTNLTEAIKQASMFVKMRHADASFSKLDDELNFYWQDSLNKLNALMK